MYLAYYLIYGILSYLGADIHLETLDLISAAVPEPRHDGINWKPSKVESRDGFITRLTVRSIFTVCIEIG